MLLTALLAAAEVQLSAATDGIKEYDIGSLPGGMPGLIAVQKFLYGDEFMSYTETSLRFEGGEPFQTLTGNYWIYKNGDYISRVDWEDLTFDGVNELLLTHKGGGVRNSPKSVFRWNEKKGKFEYIMYLRGGRCDIDEEHQTLSDYDAWSGLSGKRYVYKWNGEKYSQERSIYHEYFEYGSYYGRFEVDFFNADQDVVAEYIFEFDSSDENSEGYVPWETFLYGDEAALRRMAREYKLNPGTGGSSARFYRLAAAVSGALLLEFLLQKRRDICKVRAETSRTRRSPSASARTTALLAPLSGGSAATPLRLTIYGDSKQALNKVFTNVYFFAIF